MKQMILVSIVIILAITGLYFLYQPGFRGQAAGNLDDILTGHRGRILLLLLGRDGCPGTAKATAVLDEYATVKPKEVSIIRLDVPLPGESLQISGAWKHVFPRFLDEGRNIAGKLDFFYYPTLYVFDRDGDTRFVGGDDKEKIDLIVKEILAEKPNQTKKIYTIQLPPIGQAAPRFSGTVLTGQLATLDSLMGAKGLLILFARTSCPFSVEQLSQVKILSDQSESQGIKVIIINEPEKSDNIMPVYQKHCAGLPVIWDRNGQISKSYGVDTTPFFFLLDRDGNIVKRRSFTYEAALNSVETMLGITSEKNRFKTKEAG